MECMLSSKQIALCICYSVNILMIVLKAETTSWCMNYNFNKSCLLSGHFEKSFYPRLSIYYQPLKRGREESKPETRGQ